MPTGLIHRIGIAAPAEKLLAALIALPGVNSAFAPSGGASARQSRQPQPFVRRTFSRHRRRLVFSVARCRRKFLLFRA